MPYTMVNAQELNFKHGKTSKCKFININFTIVDCIHILECIENYQPLVN